MIPHKLSCSVIMFIVMTSTSAGVARKAHIPPSQTTIPTLILPRNNDVLDNGCENRKDGVVWEFKWSEVERAQRYHLYVSGKTAKYPVIDESAILETSYKDERQQSYIAEQHRYGWRWKVRAMVDGVWGEWSVERTFDVEPLNTDCK
jgi:hypothetical protein